MTAALLGAAQWLEGATRKEVAISGNHVSRTTAQQSGLHFTAAELQQQQQQQQTRDQSVCIAARSDRSKTDR